jgi:hypothetical protein
MQTVQCTYSISHKFQVIVPALDTQVSCRGVLAGLQSGATLPLIFIFGQEPELSSPSQPPFLEGLPFTEVRVTTPPEPTSQA